MQYIINMYKQQKTIGRTSNLNPFIHLQICMKTLLLLNNNKNKKSLHYCNSFNAYTFYLIFNIIKRILLENSNVLQTKNNNNKKKPLKLNHAHLPFVILDNKNIFLPFKKFFFFTILLVDVCKI